MEKGLCEICNPKQWKTISSDMLTENGYPVYGANGIIGYYENYNHKEPTILITCRGATCGTLNICKPFSYVNGNAMALDNLSEDIYIQYLYYYLLSRGLSDVITGSAQPQIVRQSLEKVKVKYPPLDEQRKIAAVLDKVSDLIAKRRQQLDKLDELIKARFVEMFGDLADPACKHIRCKLGETCKDSDDIKCGPFGTQLSKTEYQEQGVAVWEIPQINREFKEQPIHFVTNEKAKQLISYSLIPGDIAMSRKGNVGRCALFPKDFAPGIIHSDVLRIRVDKNKVNPCFLMYQLHFSKAVAHQIEMVSSGAVMAGINVTKLKQIYVHIPAFGLQNQFAAFVEQTEKTKTTISKSLEKLETLKKALMQEYFG